MSTKLMDANCEITRCYMESHFFHIHFPIPQPPMRTAIPANMDSLFALERKESAVTVVEINKPPGQLMRTLSCPTLAAKISPS